MERFYDDYEVITLPEEPDHIGSGLAEYNQIVAGRLRTNTGRARIEQSIRNIVQTPLGSRFFLPSFGSRVHQALFEPNDFILKDLLSLYITEAVSAWEKRAVVEDVIVDIDSNERVCYVTIKYRIKGVNSLESLDLDFCRELTK